MKDQLLRILTHFGITATRFADEIGVQRSSISHILSGRNKPSYDFIIRVIEKYPSLNPHWILTGKGNMFMKTDENEKLPEKELIQPVTPQLKNVNSDADNNNQPEYIPKTIIDISKQSEQVTNVNDIENVILLFKNGTFVSYKKNE